MLSFVFNHAEIFVMPNTSIRMCVICMHVHTSNGPDCGSLVTLRRKGKNQPMENKKANIFSLCLPYLLKKSLDIGILSDQIPNWIVVVAVR